MIQIVSFSENTPSMIINDIIRKVKGAQNFLVKFSWSRSISGTYVGKKHYFIMGAVVEFPPGMALKSQVIKAE